MADDRPDFTWDEFSSGKGPGGEPPPSDADRFKPCFRHKERTTGINCQRCDRPICGECMRPASVGFQCPVCIADQHMHSRPVTNKFGKRVDDGGGGWRSGGGSGAGGRSIAGIRLSGGPSSLTVVLMVLVGVVGVVDLVTGGMRSLGLGSRLLGFAAPEIAAGQVWRLFTGIVVSAGFLNVLISLLFLWLVGRSIEAELGRGRMLAVLLLAGLGSSAALMLLQPVAFWPMAFSGILGMLSAVAVMKHRMGEDIKGDLILFAIILVFSLLAGHPAGVISHLGAILGGGGAGAVLAYAPRAGRGRWQTMGLAGLAVLLLLLVVVGVLV